jgi:hypothetical protein
MLTLLDTHVAREALITAAVPQLLLDEFMVRGYGLAGCWSIAVAFQAVRLVVNGARLLLPSSVLSRIEPLSDQLKLLEAMTTGSGSGAER